MVKNNIKRHVYSEHDDSYINMIIAMLVVMTSEFPIATKNRYRQRRCLVAWHNIMNHHALNSDDGCYLPQEYLHLVGK